jgi:hypothetical protein
VLDEPASYNFVPRSYQEIFVTPAVRAKLFPTAAVSLWVRLGGAFAYFNEGEDLNYSGPIPGGSSISSLTEDGAGLDVRYRRLSLRGGSRLLVRDSWSGTPDLPLPHMGKTRHNYFVGSGLIWHI